MKWVGITWKTKRKVSLSGKEQQRWLVSCIIDDMNPKSVSTCDSISFFQDGFLSGCTSFWVACSILNGRPSVPRKLVIILETFQCEQKFHEFFGANIVIWIFLKAKMLSQRYTPKTCQNWMLHETKTLNGWAPQCYYASESSEIYVRVSQRQTSKIALMFS